MIVIRPTQKLAKRLRVELLPEAEPSSTVLGDWYCTLLYTRPKQLILAVSERSRLPLLFPATGEHPFEVRLLSALGRTLMALDIPIPAIADEQAEMYPTAYAKTASRSILGTINDNESLLDTVLPEFGDLMEATLWLAEVPCGPLKGMRPRDKAVELFSQPRS